MKRKVILVFGIAFALSMCQSKKMVYQFPEGMSPQIQAMKLESCRKGERLFDLNCGACHYTDHKGRRVVPDFSPEQLGNYEFRFLNKSHEDSLTEVRLSQDDLISIIDFLTYKKKSGVVVKTENKKPVD